MFMKMFSIRAKAAFGLVLLTLFILTIGSLNYMALEKMQGNTDLFAARLRPAQGGVLKADRDLYQALVAQQQLLLGGGSAGYCCPDQGLRGECRSGP